MTPGLRDNLRGSGLTEGPVGDLEDDPKSKHKPDDEAKSSTCEEGRDEAAATVARTGKGPR